MSRVDFVDSDNSKVHKSFLLKLCVVKYPNGKEELVTQSQLYLSLLKILNNSSTKNIKVTKKVINNYQNITFSKRININEKRNGVNHDLPLAAFRSEDRISKYIKSSQEFVFKTQDYQSVYNSIVRENRKNRNLNLNINME